MTDPPPSRSRARVDPNFIGYRHLCIVLVAPTFSVGERAAMAEAVAAEKAAFRRSGIGLESVESPTGSRSDWGGLCFGANSGRDAEGTLVGVFSRGTRGIELDMHRGIHNLSDREPDPRASAVERIGRFLRAQRAFLDHPGRF